MSVSGSNANNLRAVGDVVDILGPGGVVLAGTIVEDYADVVRAVDDDLDRDWAHPRRWAVALETGVLVFADDADLDIGDTGISVSN